MLSTLLRASPDTNGEEAAALDDPPITPITPQKEWQIGGAVDRYTELMMQHCIDCYSAAGLLLHRVLQGRTEEEGEVEASVVGTESEEGVVKAVSGGGKKTTRTRKGSRKSGTQHHAKNKSRNEDPETDINVDRKFNFGSELAFTLISRIRCGLNFVRINLH